jgi:branched-chain amino acid:cation transporter, LIVCS family
VFNVEEIMIGNKKFSFVFIGLALFSMFFGAGNLIYPLFVGQMAQDQSIWASLGFLITGVGVPFLGVVAMIVYQGDYTKFFQCLGSRFGSLLIAILLTVWIPLGSAPRCITLAYSSMASYIDFGPLWLFSLFYCTVIYFVIGTKGRMLDILGYVLTPCLLVCLGLIIYQGVSVTEMFPAPTKEGVKHFLAGLTEGYNTMDLIASFFFSASVIEILRSATQEKIQPVRITLKACIVGISLLALVYVNLIALAGVHYEVLDNVPKEQMLAHISKSVLGPHLGMISVAAIFLACFTTSVALVVVYADFLNKTLFKSHPSDFLAKMTTLAITFVISLTGLAGITMITAPILEIFYPLLIVMIIVNLSIKGYQRYALNKVE